jgi:hypothetical protein
MDKQPTSSNNTNQPIPKTPVKPLTKPIVDSTTNDVYWHIHNFWIVPSSF